MVSLAQAREPDPAPVMAVLGRIEASLRTSTYSHVTRVDEAAGRYDFDCSGMVSWVLRRAAPRAQGAVAWGLTRQPPLARDYYQRIAATRAGRDRYGWRRIERVADAQPGDVIAWIKPREIRSPNTGHVAFIVDAPRAVPGSADRFLVRIADASSFQHQDDTRAGAGRTGYGRGTILVVTDAQGAPIAYGWAGERSRWVFETRIAIGRPVR